MENDFVEEELDAPLPPPFRRRRTPNPDHKIRRISSTGSNISGTEPDEQSPLLTRTFEFQDAPTANDDDRPPPAWSGERDHEGKPWYQTPSVLWLLPSFLIYALAFGGVIVPKLDLILSLICKDYLAHESLMHPTRNHTTFVFGQENAECPKIAAVQALTSNFMLYASLISGILSAVTSPKLGALSDRYGRTRVMACTSVGMLIAEIITIIAATYPETVSVYWILVGYACDGFCGSFTAGMAITNAYASDCTAPPRRSVTFALFQGCLFTGIAFGPILSGYIVKYSGSLVSIFYVVLVAHSFFVFTLVFIIPESLTKERQMAAREKAIAVGKTQAMERERPSASALARAGQPWWVRIGKNLMNGYGLFTPLSILWPTGEGTNSAVRRNLVFLAAVDTTMFGVAMGSMSIIIIYSKYMFGWDTLQSSVFISSVNISRVSCLLILLPLVTRLVRGKPGSRSQANTGCDQLDLWSIRTALIFDISGYIGYTLARSGNLLIASGILAAVGGIGSPTLQSSLTKHVPPDRTGQLLGAIGLLHALARIVSPVIFNTIYSHTVKTFPQTVFICLASTFGIGFILSWFIRPHGESFLSPSFWNSSLSVGVRANKQVVHYDEPDISSKPGNDEEVDDTIR